MSLQESVSELRKAASELNVASDQFTEILLQFEQKLKELNLGIEAEVPFEDGKYLLRYGKLPGHWGLIVITVANGAYWSIKDSPRRLRLSVVDVLPQLTDALIESTERTLVDLNKALMIANEIAEALQEVKK